MAPFASSMTRERPLLLSLLPLLLLLLLLVPPLLPLFLLCWLRQLPSVLQVPCVAGISKP